MKLKGNHLILIFEIAAIISLHAVKMNRQATAGNVNKIISKNVNAELVLPGAKAPVFTLASVKK